MYVILSRKFSLVTLLKTIDIRRPIGERVSTILYLVKVVGFFKGTRGNGSHGTEVWVGDRW